MGKKSVIQSNLGPAVGLAVIKRAGSYAREREHFFQANCLGAEPRFVRAVGFGFSPLVFHGNNAPVAVELDDITLPGEPEDGGRNRNPTDVPDSAL